MKGFPTLDETAVGAIIAFAAVSDEDGLPIPAAPTIVGVKIKVDENIPLRLVAALRDVGHDVQSAGRRPTCLLPYAVCPCSLRTRLRPLAKGTLLGFETVKSTIYWRRVAVKRPFEVAGREAVAHLCSGIGRDARGRWS